MPLGEPKLFVSDYTETGTIWSTATPGSGAVAIAESAISLPDNYIVYSLATDGRGNWAGAAVGEDNEGYVWSHDDGATWGFTVAPTVMERSSAPRLIHDGFQFVAYGYGRTRYDYCLGFLVSPDGETWTAHNNGLPGPGPVFINGYYYGLAPGFEEEGAAFYSWLVRKPNTGLDDNGLGVGHSPSGHWVNDLPSRQLLSDGTRTLLFLTGQGGAGAVHIAFLHRPWDTDFGPFAPRCQPWTDSTYEFINTDGAPEFGIDVYTAVWCGTEWRAFGRWVDAIGFEGSTTDRGPVIGTSPDGEHWEFDCQVGDYYAVDSFWDGYRVWHAMAKAIDGISDNAIGYDTTANPDFTDDFGTTDGTHQNLAITGPDPILFHSHGEGGFTISGTGHAHRVVSPGDPQPGGFEISGSGFAVGDSFSRSEFKTHFRKRHAFRKKDFFYLHNVNNRTFLPIWDIEQSQACSVIADATALLRVTPPELLPATGPIPAFILRHSEMYVDPTIVQGKPTGNWNAYDTIIEPWARVRVLVDGKDFTYYRDIPCVIQSWEINEPFGDASATIHFPQVTKFEHPTLLWPRWANVQIQAMKPDGRVVDLFDGMLAEYHDERIGTTIQAQGAFYEADLLLRRPTFQDEKVDISNHIVTTINGFIMLYALNLSQMPETLTGVERRARGYFEPTATGYIQNLLGFLEDAAPDKWTIECQSRQPILKTKDRTTVHWTVMNGARGIEAVLNQDLIADPNVIFGEGQAENNEYWRNTKYPGMPGSVYGFIAPLWPGFAFGLGYSGDYVKKWEAAANRIGYGASVDGYFGQDDADSCTQMQMDAGLTVTGTVTAQTWAYTFDIGANNGDIGSVYIAPIAYYSKVDPALYNFDGGIRELNPQYDPSIPRIEKFINFGPGVDKELGKQSAVRQIQQNYFNRGWKGTLSLKSDPQEGSRFEIRAGQNILLRKYRGSDELLHIAKASQDLPSLTTHLTVDTRARDLPTLAAQHQRDAEALQDPGSKFRTFRNQSYQKEDRWPIWDSESGCGIVPIHYTDAKTWNVLRIPFGKYGEIVAVDFSCSPATEFSLGVFNRPIFPNVMAMNGSPLDDDPFWDKMDQYNLVMAWGQGGQLGVGQTGMCGHSPIPSSGDLRSDPPLTGRLLDKSSWTYASDFPPWMYVAIWTTEQTIIEGRFYPGTKSGEALPVLFGTPPDGGGGGGG